MTPQEQARLDMGNRLKIAREYMGLSQEDVGQVLGIARTAVVKMESGQRKVDALELSALATLYEQPLAILAGEESAPPLTEGVMALARTASELSDVDREAVIRFAHFLNGEITEP